MPNSFTSSFRRYLVRTFGALAAMLGLALAASVILVKYVVEPHDRVIQSLALIRRERSPDAAFGDSHFAWGFVGTEEFPTLAAEGETLADMELRVRYYYRDKQPRRVVIQGDPHAFAAYKLDRATHAYLENLDNQFWQRFVDHHRPYLGEYWRTALRGGVKAFRPKNALRWGWIVGQEDWSSLAENVRLARSSERVKRLAPVTDLKDNQFAQSYQRTLEYLRQRGAEVCVVTTPVSYEYYKYSSGNATIAATIDFLRGVAERNGARYVNFYDIYARPEFANYFRDMDHLNQNGAPRFTERALSACFDRPTGTVPVSGK